MSMQSFAAGCLFDDEWPRRKREVKVVTPIEGDVPAIVLPSYMARVYEILRRDGPMGPGPLARALAEPGVNGSILMVPLDLAVGAGFLLAAEGSNFYGLTYSWNHKRESK